MNKLNFEEPATYAKLEVTSMLSGCCLQIERGFGLGTASFDFSREQAEKLAEFLLAWTRNSESVQGHA